MAYRKEKYWSQFSRSYDEDAEYVVGKSLREAIAEKLRGERGLGEVVEFGCGTGYFTRAIAENAKRVIATDLSDEMVEAAKTQLKNVENVAVQKDDCERPSFPPLTFDTVFMANVLHTVENPDAALAESRRLLKDQGLLLVTCYTDYGTNWLEKIELGLRYFQRFGMPPVYYRNYSPREMAGLVQVIGFKVHNIQLISGTMARAIYLKAVKVDIQR